MSSNAAAIIGSLAGTFALCYAVDYLHSDYKLYGGTIPKTLSKEWQDETKRLRQTWPRTAGPPIALNPIRNQNYTVKSRSI